MRTRDANIVLECVTRVVIPICFVIAITINSLIVGIVGASDSSEPRRIIEIQNAIEKATRFLVQQQLPDGTWRSQTYGLLKDETSLTSLVLWSLPDTPISHDARIRGVATMASWLEVEPPPGHVRIQPQYPAYTASLNIRVLTNEKSEGALRQVRIWQDLLIAHQLTEQNGWASSDARFGGWGYSHDLPLKSAEGMILSPLEEPNLSATVFALEGIISSQLPKSVQAEIQSKALRFVSRCQNWREGSPSTDDKFNDGGFYFVLDDNIRNKPGIAGIDSTRQKRFISYGSATADGLRALLLCGLAHDHPRVVAAVNWLTRHFGQGDHPGTYPTEREHLKPSLDFYYAASLSNLFRRQSNASRTDACREWASSLADQLIQRQHEDGAWRNTAVDVREDDPLIATSFALYSLQQCLDLLK